jgi:hypothetical protein
MSGIIIASANIAMTRLVDRGSSTVCRAKLSVLSTAFEPKVSLPDTTPPLGAYMLFKFAADKDFFISLPRSVPNFVNQSPSVSQD